MKVSMNLDLFIHAVNTERKQNKGKWWTFIGHCENKEVKIKGFNTWIQRMEFDGCTDAGPMDCSVKVFNEYLRNTLTRD